MTKYKVRSEIGFGEEREIEEAELEAYQESTAWTVVGRANRTPGANVISDDEDSGSETEELALADPKDEYQSDEGDTLKVNPDSYFAQNSALLTDEEKEAMQDPEPESGEFAKSEEEFWSDIEEECNQLQAEAREKEKRQSRRETLENNDWMKPDHLTKKFKDMTGEEIAMALNSDPSEVEEELLAELAESEADTEPDHVAELDSEVVEEAAQAWESRGGVWEELAQGLRSEELGGNDVDSVKIESHDGGQTIAKKRSDGSAVLKTEHPVTREELADVMDVDSGQNVHQVSDVDGQLTVEIDSLEKLEETLA